MANRNSWIFYLTIGAIMTIGVGTGAVVAYGKTRGLRNNNPGNIRRTSSVVWHGAVQQLDGSRDDSFVQFQAPEYGIRAIARILANYAKRGIVTVESIIGTWAPPIENDTNAYIASVQAHTGWPTTRRVTPADYPALISAIIHQENGIQPYPQDIIHKGINLA